MEINQYPTDSVNNNYKLHKGMTSCRVVVWTCVLDWTWGTLWWMVKLNDELKKVIQLKIIIIMSFIYTDQL